ncbi:MAG TPA: VOC family protein [Candidatus Paceibacterota bacterium]
MQKIIPHLWFDKEAKEAAAFYASVFPESGVTYTATIKGTPSGDCDIVSFNIMGTEFQAISAGPYFKINPSISMMINFDPSQNPDAEKLIDEVWAKLSEGGKALMPLDAYPFSKRYGWVEDKFGFTWQLILTNPEGEERPRVIPSLLFTKDVCGKAEEASNFYMSVFKDSKRGAIARYPAGMEPNKEGTVMFTDFKLADQWFAAMDGAGEHVFSFGEGVSLIVHCASQEEMDYYTNKLSAVPEAEQCGWVKDKFGVSWQIVPTIMDEVMASGDQEKIDRVTRAMLDMKRLDLAALTKAANGE